jgi:L-ascorbate metabolism protein UlaG (beta-lactamase superfamily)
MQTEKLLSLCCIFGLMVWGCRIPSVERPEPIETLAPAETADPLKTAEPPKTAEQIEATESVNLTKKPRKQIKIEAVKKLPAPVVLQWFGHASFKIYLNDVNIYIDPWKLDVTPHDATIVLISHTHRDHCSVDDIAKISGPNTQLIAPADVLEETGRGLSIWPGKTIELAGIKIIGTAAYNPDKPFHPQDKQWLGFIIEIGEKRVYYAGDTDIIDEMQNLGPIDLALIPVGGSYTMNGAEAAQAIKIIKPALAVPYHYGDIIGTLKDAVQFTENAQGRVHVMLPGEKIIF